jgi:hypothetical protein
MYDVLKLLCSISLRTHRKQNALSQLICKCLSSAIDREIIYWSYNERAKHWSRDHRIVPSRLFLNRHAFIFLSFCQKFRKSEECNKDVKLSGREPRDFIASNCFMALETAKIYKMLQAGMIL